MTEDFLQLQTMLQFPQQHLKEHQKYPFLHSILCLHIRTRMRIKQFVFFSFK